MNRIMLLGLLVRISRVALCGVMGVMAETVARRAGSIGLRGLCRLCVVAYALILAASFAPMDSARTVVHRAVPLLFLVRLILEPRELFVFVQQRRRLLVRAVAIHQQRRLILGWFQFRPAHRHWRQRRPCPERAMQARKHLHGWRLQHLPMIRHMMRAFLPADVQTGLAKNEF